MKKQEGEFLKKRDKVRHHLIMTRLGLKNQTYQKIMQQLSNGKYNQPFNDKEVETLNTGLQVVIDACKDLQEELKKKD
jgi:hypothetical protein